jgi:tape measure domain-containing protein
MNSIGDLYIQLHATARGLAEDIRNDLRRAQGGLTAQAVAMGTLIADGIKRGLSITGNFFSEQLKNASKLSAEMETTTTLFGVLLGSAEKAKQAIAEIRIIDQQSPLSFGQLTQSGQLLLAMGESAEKLTTDLRLLGTVALGNSERMGRLTYAFGQVQSLGRLAGTELRQLTELGFNPLEYISKRTGETMAQLTHRMSEGKISFGEMRLAMIDATMAGGRFNGALEEMEKTFQGKVAKLTGAIDKLMVSIGNGLNASIKPIIEDMIADLDKLMPAAKGIGEGLGRWIGAVYQWAGGFKGIINTVIDIGIKISDWLPRLSAVWDLLAAGWKGLMNGAEVAGAAFIGSVIIAKNGAVAIFEWFKVKWQEVKKWGQEAATGIKTWFIEMINSVLRALNALPEALGAIVDSLPVPAWMKAGSRLVGQNVRKSVSNVVKAAAGPGGYGEPELPGGVAMIDDSLIPMIKLPVQPDIQVDQTALEDATENVRQAAKGMADAAREPIQNIVDASKEATLAVGDIFKDPSENPMVKSMEDMRDSLNQTVDASADASSAVKVDWNAVRDQQIVAAKDATAALASIGEEQEKERKKAVEVTAKELKSERAEFLRDFESQYEDIQRINEQTFESFRSMNRSATSDMVSSWITGTGKISDIVSQWADSMIRQFVEVMLFGNKMAGGTMSGLLGSMGGLFGGKGTATGLSAGAAAANTYAGAGGGGGWISALGSLVGGFFADGGRPPMGKVSVVGERGPELFVPDSAGTVIPNNRAASYLAAPAAAGGGGGEAPMIFHFTQNFSSGVTQLELAGAMDQMQDATRGAVLEAVQRGGAYRKGMQT